MRLLVSGFEPFDGMTENSSQTLMADLSKEHFSFELKTLVLPVSFNRAFLELKHHIDIFQPDAVVATGVAVSRKEITPERIAINWNEARTQDNDGEFVKGPSVPGAPDGLFSTLPIQAMTDLSNQAGVPASISNSAGTYVCNHVMFQLLYHLKEASIPIGFVHLPPTQVIPRERIALGFKKMLEALILV